MIDIPEITKDERDLRILAQKTNLCVQFICLPFIIIIKESDQATSCLLQRLVKRVGLALVRFSESANARVFESRDDIFGIVAGTIIPNEQLPSLIGLVQDGINRPWQQFCPVIGWQDNGDQFRLCHRSPR